MCWAVLDRGIALAEQSLRQAPLERWREQRDTIRATIERDGYDEERGIFVQSFGSTTPDALLLLLPGIDFVACSFWLAECLAPTEPPRRRLGGV